MDIIVELKLIEQPQVYNQWLLKELLKGSITKDALKIKDVYLSAKLIEFLLFIFSPRI